MRYLTHIAAVQLRQGAMCIIVRRTHMDKIKSLLQTVDRAQQSHTAISFPVAVVKRYGDERIGKQAALVTYYAFLSLFPLLMIFITVLGVAVANNPSLENRIMQTVFQLFPALGNDLRAQVHTLRASGLALFLQSLVVIYGARGLASILQETFNNIWHVAPEHRPGFWDDHKRSFAMMCAVGFGIIVGTAVSYSLNSVLHIGFLGTVLINTVNILITFGLFLAVFRLGTSHSINLKRLIVGAIVATIGTIIIQRLGGIIMHHELPRLQGSYGSFALALGMLFWIYLQAQVILYALVITVVRAERDWPKQLF
jgi:YihY family inner membrane protein